MVVKPNINHKNSVLCGSPIALSSWPSNEKIDSKVSGGSRVRLIALQGTVSFGRTTG